MGKAKDAFVVAEVEDDTDEAIADKYNIDGGYVPRIYFLGPDGKIMADIWNVGTQYLENKFYYYEMSSVLRAMDKASSRFKELKEQNNSQEKEENSTNKDKDAENIKGDETHNASEETNAEKKKEEKKEENNEDKKEVKKE